MAGFKMRYIVTVLSLILLIGFEGCIFEDILPLNADIINYNSDGPCGTVASVDLLSGDKKVGSVTVSINEDTLQVVFFTEPGVYIRYLRYHIGIRAEDFPQDGGNPDTKEFFYDEKTKKILLSALTGSSAFSGNIYIAAFARVAYGDILSETGEASIERTHKLGDPSYFVTTLTVPDRLASEYYAYCLQGDQLMDVDTIHTINLVSSMSPDTSLLESVVDEPQNLDLVNWVLNQQRSTWIRSDNEPATGADIQMAIWRLIESTGTPTGTYIQNKFDPALVNKIVEDARLKGDGFRAVCGQKELIVLHKGPVGELSDKGNYNTGLYANPNYQVSGIVKTITCSNDERDCWADGTPFPGNVGTYFGFCID